MSITEKDMLIPEWDTQKNSKYNICARCSISAHCVSKDGMVFEFSFQEDINNHLIDYAGSFLCNHCFDDLTHEDSCKVKFSEYKNHFCTACRWF